MKRALANQQVTSRKPDRSPAAGTADHGIVVTEGRLFDRQVAFQVDAGSAAVTGAVAIEGAVLDRERAGTGLIQAPAVLRGRVT